VALANAAGEVEQLAQRDASGASYWPGAFT
jgi:hypothetical protein